MPELPEVEAVRRGLARHLTGRTVGRVDILDARALRRQAGGPRAFTAGLEGRTILAAVRRGKFLWLPLDDGAALAAHLGMSGQLLVRGTGPAPHGDGAGAVDPHADRVDLTARRAPEKTADLTSRPRHLRLRIGLDPVAGRGHDRPRGAACLDLVDQRLFGGLWLTELVSTGDGAPGGVGSPEPLLPAHAAHIARDLLDPALDLRDVSRRMRRSGRAVKTLLLDQTLASGVGNIYADEGLWAARLHGRRRGEEIGPRQALRLLERTGEVMERALAVGGTSFDALYVNAEGAAGFFARELAAYGRAGKECRRCGSIMRAETIGGRSHTFCPRCQVRPRRRWT